MLDPYEVHRWRSVSSQLDTLMVRACFARVKASLYIHDHDQLPPRGIEVFFALSLADLARDIVGYHLVVPMLVLVVSKELL